MKETEPTTADPVASRLAAVIERESHEQRQQRFEACSSEIAAVLRKHSARLIATIEQEQVGQVPGSRFLMAARPAIALEPLD